MSFKYVFIPANENEPVQELTASKAGGLQDDALRKSAEQKFSSGSVDKDSQRAAVIDQLKGKGIESSKIDEILNSSYGDKLAGSVEIITLAVPTTANGFSSVSLYCDGNSAFKKNGKIVNTRATAIARACGHGSIVVMGDCYAGRAHDDESKEWERLDFQVSELDTSANWVQHAARCNAGKNLSGYSTSGALSALQAQQGGGKGTASAAPPAPVGPPPSEFSSSEMFVWNQTDEEVEVRMKLPAGMLSKHLCVEIGADRLYVGRKNAKSSSEAILEGVDPQFSSGEGPDRGAKLSGAVSTGDSTWSIADEREGRMLTVSLAKATIVPWKKLL